jgi:hypothetical protein
MEVQRRAVKISVLPCRCTLSPTVKNVGDISTHLLVEIVLVLRVNNEINGKLVDKTQIEWARIKFDYCNSFS